MLIPQTLRTRTPARICRVPKMRRAAKVDANQAQIVAALRAIGASVQPLHTVGGGCPDLAVGVNGVTLLIEIKDGAKRPSARKLTSDEAKWHQEWRGHVDVVEDVEEALSVVRLARERGRVA